MNGRKSEEAYQLLLKDVITSESDLLKTENRWIWHCLYVGLAAGRIATRLGVDADLATALGFVHDIGRKWSHEKHVMAGYQYLTSLGETTLARVCLTHSYIDNDLKLVAGEDSTPEQKPELSRYLLEHPVTIYDNIVQLCDLFCLDTGFTTVEKRMLDISERKGIFLNSFQHLNAVFSLKTKLENQMGCSLYTLFPEISKEDLQSIDKDYDKLVSLVSSGMQKVKIDSKN